MSRARNLADLLNASGKIKSSKLDGETVGNDTLDSQHYAAGSIDLEHLSSESVDEDNLYVSNAGTNGQYLQKQSGNAGGLTWGTVDLTTLSATNLTSGIVPTARINAGSIANDLLDSQHYAAGSIDTEHLAADSVTTAKIADSVALGGSPTTTTQSAADNSTKVATTAYADAAVAALADSAPSTLNTLNELAAALGDDANYAATTTTAIALKAPIASPTFTGDIGMPNGSIDKAMIGADQVDGSKIEDDSINSEHIADGAIDLAHMSSQSVDEDNLYISNAGTDGQYLQKQSGNNGGLTWGTVDLTTLSGANLTSGIIPTARINASSIANDLLDSQHYAAGSIDREHLAADIIDGTKIADDAINSEHYAAGSIDNEHISGMAASKLTGALPAISGASLTNLPTPSLLVTAGGVGSYMVASYSSHNTTARAAGYTFAGSLLKHRWAQPSTANRVYPSDFSGGQNYNNQQSAGVGGTWRAMHPFRNGNWTSHWTYAVVLCQRIS